MSRPAEYFDQQSKAGDAVLALLCAVKLSPLSLMCGQPLYGSRAVLKAHHVIAVSYPWWCDDYGMVETI